MHTFFIFSEQKKRSGTLLFEPVAGETEEMEGLGLIIIVQELP